MKSKIFSLFALLILFNTITNGQKLGLKFTDPNVLAGIPLASTPFSGQELPEQKDLSGNMPPPGNQGNQSSCVGWSVAYAVKSYQEKIEENNSYSRGGQVNFEAVFSPAFIYNQINNGQDGGSLFTDALNVVSQQGAAKWKDMPYNVNDYLTRPTTTQKAKAKNYKIDFWRKVNIFDIKEVKAQLNAGYPVMIGAMVDEGFIKGGYGVGATPYIWKNFSGSSKGGHAMVVVGYDNRQNAFKVINSWGTRWGNNGYCWIEYNHFTRAVREGYVMKDAINEQQPVVTTDRPVNPQPNNPVNPSPNQPYNPQPNKPKPYNPAPQVQTQFSVSGVQHNLTNYNYGAMMQVNGSVLIPKSSGRQFQIVVQFYYNAGDAYNPRKGKPVGSTSYQFMMPDGTAATGTGVQNIDGNTTNQTLTWYAQMPYNMLNVQKGTYDYYGNYNAITTYLIAEPTLYIDNFAVKLGQQIPFYVNL